MTLTSLQALTWSTVTGAVVSALLLASGESGWPELSRWRRSDARPAANQPPPVPRKEDPTGPAAARQPAPAQPSPR
jgi:hypothetical protein